MITMIYRNKHRPRRALSDLLAPTEGQIALLLTNLAGTTIDEWANEIELIATLRPRGQKHIVKHMVLSFAPEDRLSMTQLGDIARTYLQLMGYAEAPYAAFHHRRSTNECIHIITTATSYDGKPVSTAFDWYRSMRVARQIEVAWKLRIVKSPARTRSPKTSRQRQPKKAALCQDGSPSHSVDSIDHGRSPSTKPEDHKP